MQRRVETNPSAGKKRKDEDDEPAKKAGAGGGANTNVEDMEEDSESEDEEESDPEGEDSGLGTAPPTALGKATVNAAPSTSQVLLRHIHTVEFHELGQKVRILGQGQEQDSSVD